MGATSHCELKIGIAISFCTLSLKDVALLFLEQICYYYPTDSEKGNSFFI